MRVHVLVVVPVPFLLTHTRMNISHVLHAGDTYLSMISGVLLFCFSTRLLHDYLFMS